MTLRDDATLRDELNALTPRLRRYARALTTGHAAPSELADDLVHATLMRALGARHIGAPSELIIRLYATVTQLNREVALSGLQARAAGAGRPTLIATGRNFSTARQTQLSAGLLALQLEAREALLLVGLEGFDYAQAARILRISRSVMINRLTQARISLDASLRANPVFSQVNSAQDGHAPGRLAPRTSAQANQASGRQGARVPGKSRAPHLRLVT